MSWNRKDWFKLAGLLGLGATGAGLAGVGPMAGLLGSTGQGLAAGAAGAALPAGAMGPVTAGAPLDTAVGVGAAFDKAMGATNAVGKAYAGMNAAQGMLSPPPAAPVAPPPQNQFQPTPVSSPYGGLNDQPPPGIDPRQWAMMSPEQKRRFKGGV